MEAKSAFLIKENSIKKIREGYFTFFSQQNDFPVLIIDTSKIDFVAHNAHYGLLRNLVSKPIDWTGIKREILLPDF